MLNRLPPLHALRVFEAVARLSNFTNAAAELNLTQSAVSHQIRNLEEFFQCLLIIRDKRRLSLTPEGAELYLSTQEAMNVISDVTQRIMARHSQIRITSLPSMSVRFLMPRLGDFYSRHPGLEVAVTTVWQHGGPGRFDQYDFAIRFGAGDAPDDGAELLHEECLTAVCVPSLLSGLHTPDHDMLSRHTLIHPTGIHDDWRMWLKLGFDLEFQPGGPQQLVDTDDLAIEAALAGIGIAVIDPVYVCEELGNGRLVEPFGKRIKTGRSYYLVARGAPSLTTHQQHFRDWIFQAMTAAERVVGQPTAAS